MHLSTTSPSRSTRDEPDRVRRHTSLHDQERIDSMTRENVREYAGQPRHVLDQRIGQLERTWDMERVLELNASVLALTGAVLGVTRDRRWFLLTGTVLSFMIQHATMGWCPPVPMFRKLGVRTQGEIDQERYALKALRGDFTEQSLGRAPAAEVLRAVAR